MVFKRRDRRPWWKIVYETVWPKGGWKRAFYYIKHRVRRLPDPPHRIARGIFAGIFVTFSPFFGMHFFAAAAEAMRRILIDRARARGALKRGGSARHLTLDPATLSLDSIPAEVADLDEALTRFEAEDPQKAALVKLRFYGGLTLKQAAAALGLAPATADRHWAYARAWLFQALSVEESKFSDSQ